jgi:indolepyruvate ferredoxin oxidoreductase, alpha subunit
LSLAKEVMIGNFAIARGLFEAGLEIAAAYPGTPSSEILPGIIQFRNREKASVHAEWSTNERCALEVTFGAAMSGKRAACMMKQVGLNVAFPSLLRAKERPIKGGLVIVSCDDPGPQSSQTEQDTRLLAILFDIPVFDPATPSEAGDVAYHALNHSFETKRPVIVRSTHRVSHAREAIALYPPNTRRPMLREGITVGKGRRLGIVASGMSSSIAADVIRELGVEDHLSLFKVLQIHPLDTAVLEFVRTMDQVLVLEETDQVLEALIGSTVPVLGRERGYVPDAGELSYDVVRNVVGKILVEGRIPSRSFTPDLRIDEALSAVNVPPRPPTLCAGCPHRASFYAMKQAFPDAVFPGDIGCYTLGIALGAVDTCLDMGAGVTLASGFQRAFSQDGTMRPILASVGDSTFFHSCLSPLYQAIRQKHRFVLVLMDNGTTAMTGMQPTPQTGVTADGTVTKSISIEEFITGMGVPFLRILDPYEVPRLIETIKEAYGFMEENKTGPAVIIARHECLLARKGAGEPVTGPVNLADDCVGCRICIETFGCPAIDFDEEAGMVRIDERLCTGCGICLYVCPMKLGG